MVTMTAGTLAGLLTTCAPQVGHVTMAAIVQYESANHPYAIGDNSTRESYVFNDRMTAETAARGLIARGHDLDMGLAQINVSHLGEPGVSVTSVFEPCANLSVGSRILVGDYRRAERIYGPGQAALGHALSAYNTGNLYTGSRYANAVVATAAMLPALFAAGPSRLRHAPPAVRVATTHASDFRSPLIVRFADASRQSAAESGLAPIVVAAPSFDGGRVR